MLLPLLAFALACTGSSPEPGDGGSSADGGSADGGAGDGGGPDGGGDGGGSDGGGSDGGGSDGGGTDGGGTDGGGTDGGGMAEGPPATILMIGDGMGYAHVAGGGLFAHGAMGSLVMETLPVLGRLQTASLTGLTDSAASGTAMSTGIKTWNGVLGLDRSMEPIENLVEVARTRGIGTGIVTTDRLTGATPSSFLVHQDSRGDQSEIGEDWALDPPDLALGGGAELIDPFLVDGAIQIVRSREALAAADLADLPLMGLFARTEMPFVAEDDGTTPTLQEMTQAALDALEADPEGFFLMVEGARIDQASHLNRTELVHAETAAFDLAVAAVLAWAEAHPERPLTLIVTADHECGGLEVEDGSAAGEVPRSSWLWGDHTNVDVPVFAMGPGTELLDGQRLHNPWIHAILRARLADEALVEPVLPRLADGDTRDLGPAVTTQRHESSFAVGYNQLDALHVVADAEGLWIGVDGVFDRESNAPLLLLDLDFGQDTGLGADGLVLDDLDGDLDSLLSSLQLSVGLDGLGIDAAVGALHSRLLKGWDMKEDAGLRGLHSPWGEPADLWWLPVAINTDDGNLARGEPAPDAGPVGETEGGMEVWIPWEALYPEGLPSEGQQLALAMVLVNDGGDRFSNQVLPPLPSAEEPGASLELGSVVLLEVGGDGLGLGEAIVVP